MHVEGHHPLAELSALERLETDADRAKRLRIVILAITGYTAPAIAMSVGLSRRICQRWVYRYNQFGLEGLEDRRGNFCSGGMTAEEIERFRIRIEAGPTPEEKICTLRGADFQRILHEEFGRLRSLAAVYNLLHKLGYSCLKPRPKHRKSDPVRQAAFLQELPQKLKKIATDNRWKAVKDLLRGRIAIRTARLSDDGLGPEEQSAISGPADGIRLCVGSGSDLPGDRARRGPDQPLPEYRRDQRVSGSVRRDCRSG